MHLKRIELFGFKSFADRTEIEFDAGVTAVVGPNGSGKSNVCDAVRWVLGEQSARQLRGLRMEDVIFDGSESRRALGIAEVTLTMDNGDGALPIDYAEVMLTRRMFRSGDSEYYINKVPCRLKDITDLLSDTGMGKEAYSIISQGRVDEILSNRPEDRRALFEEAAGITRFKSRKLDAQRHLAETATNLTRVGDIIVELEGQLGPLADQAATARRNNELCGELKHLEVSVLAKRIATLRQDYEQSGAVVNARNEQLQAVGDRLIELEGEADAANAALTEAAQTREQASTAANTAQATVERLSLQQEALTNRNAELTAGEGDLTSRLAEGEQRRAALQGELAVAEENRAVVAATVGERQAAVTEQEQALATLRGSAAEQVAAGERLKNAVFGLLSDSAEQRNLITAARAEAAAATRRVDGFRADITAATTEGDGAEARRQQATAQLELVRGRLAAAEAAITARTQERQDAERLAESATQDVRVRSGRVGLLGSKLKVLEENERRYDGYARGVRAVLQAKHGGNAECGGAIGAVVELISAPAEYGRAIEMAIGGAAQNIVVGTDDDARRAIEYLRRTDNGRATFLPLSVMRPTPLHGDEARAAELEGALGFADKLVSFEPAYASVVQWLLNRVLIVRDLDSGVRIARATGHRLKIVTLAGDVLHRGGSMTGGSYAKETAGLFLRRQEVETLRTELATLEDELQAARQREAQLRAAVEAAGAAGESARDERYQAALAVESAERDLGVTQAELARAATAAQAAEVELEAATRELAEAEARGAAAETELARVTAELALAQTALTEAEAAGKRGGAASEQLAATVTGLKVSLAEAEGELARAGDSCETLRSRLAELTTEQERMSREIAELAERRGTIVAELADCGEQLTAATVAAEAAVSVLNEAKEAEERLRTEGAAREREVRSLRRQSDSLQAKVREADVERARIEVELGQASGQLRDDYQLTPEQGEEQGDATIDVATATVRIDEIKEAVRELGPVNAQAIEDFERVRDRCEFLRRQQLDLELAKGNLLQVITEMDELMERRFSEQFELIKGHFSQVFQELFGGGQAELHLTDPGNLLETGIEIKAQPPGKKLQNLSLLSGGERALTATALLFAVLRVKPSPFYVLDEIDAALDEHNIEKFGRFMRHVSDSAQFIVITHQKRTMEAADVMYGVTMQESGVSKIISVRLSEKVG